MSGRLVTVRMRGRTVATRAMCLMALGAFAGCGPGPLQEEAHTGAVAPRLAVLAGPSLAPPAEEVRLQLSGPSRTIVAEGAPGDTVTIEELEPGEYELKLQGFADPYIVWTSHQRVVVLPATVSEPEVVPVPFEVTDLATTSSLPLVEGEPLELSWTPVSAALDYLVEWSTDALFASEVRDTVVSTADAAVDLGAFGTYWVRVAPRDSVGAGGFPVALADSVQVRG